MIDLFFYSQMVNIICCPIYIYDTNGKLTDKIGGENKEWWAWLGYDSEKVHSILFERKEYPVIHTGKNGYVVVVFYDFETGRAMVAGPVSFGEDSVKKKGKRKELIMKKDETPAYCCLNKFVSGCLLLNWMFTGNKMEICDLWKNNREHCEKIQKIEKTISDDMFERQENYGKHNPCEQEMRELESIEKGDREALRESISETYEGSIGILAKDPLRHYKNVAIGNITLASRAAIRGGMSSENSFSLADSMIQQVEEIGNIPEVEMFKRECQFIYANAVNEENSKRRGMSSENNPLVGKVKDYIFNHLHSRIKVSDIAESLQINPNYLSHVFSVSEKITIKKYIIQEKIRKSQNLLKYSDYRVQEIGFYLGFSSQSHFTRSFYEITGMKPNEYRKKYGYTQKWK